MASEVILVGPSSEVYNTYAAASPAPGGGPGTSGTPILNTEQTSEAIRGVRPLGTQLILQDGRKFRFALAGGVTLVVGNVISSAAVLTTDVDMTPLTGTPNFGGTVGDRSVSFTHGAATVVLNYFAEGYVLVTITPGFGDVYRISKHLALANATAGDQVFFSPGNAIRRALTSSSRISLAANRYASVIQCAATISGAVVGVAVSAITNAQFGWLQTRGECGVLGVGTLTIGSPGVALLSGGTAGAAAPASAATQPIVGMVLGVEATTQASILDLRIDG